MSTLRTYAVVLLAGLLWLVPGPVRSSVAASVACPCTLAWDPLTGGNVAGYAVYYGLVGSSITNRLDAGGTPTATIYNLTVASNYWFWVAAYNAARVEGNPSPVICYRPPALSAVQLAMPAAGSLKLQFRTAPGAVGSVQYADSLSPPQWQTLGSATADTNGMISLLDPLSNRSPVRYYRAVR